MQSPSCDLYKTVKKTNFRVALKHTVIATYENHYLQSILSADERITRNNYLQAVIFIGWQLVGKLTIAGY